jgi:hypothetical protein
MGHLRMVTTSCWAFTKLREPGSKANYTNTVPFQAAPQQQQWPDLRDSRTGEHWYYVALD